MALLDISTVSRRSNHPTLLGHSVDRPKPGASDSYAIHSQGWALGRHAPVTAVEFLHAGDKLIEVPTGVERPDIAAAFPDVAWARGSGFRASISALDLPPDFELEVRAVLEGGRRALLATIRGRRPLLRSAFEPRFQPLVLTCLGRSGSTWVTRLLGQHPEIVAYRPFQYDPRVSAYWIGNLRDLSRPSRYRPPLIWPPGVDRPPPPLLDPDVEQWLGHEQVESIATFCQQQIDAFYREVARAVRQPQARYFVEKSDPAPAPATTLELYPEGREVVLVRDFRDMLCSVLAFNAKRGFEDFGRQVVDSDRAYVGHLGELARLLLRTWKRSAGRAYLLRYEDTIRRPVETLVPLFEHLEVESSSATVRDLISRASEDTPAMADHRTSGGSAESSVGRWRHDLDPALQRLCDETFGDVLDEFGYDPAGKPAQ
jgi:hypothetical protein